MVASEFGIRHGRRRNGDLGSDATLDDPLGPSAVARIRCAFGRGGFGLFEESSPMD